MRIMLSSLMLCTLAACTSSAPSMPSTSSKAAIASADQPGSDSIQARASAVFKDISPKAPGCAASAIRSGKVIWDAGFGMADLATGRKIDPDTIFNVASISKQFTAFAILQLDSAGKLSIDDPIRKYLPEIGQYAHAVKIRHLIHHTGGLRDYEFLANLVGIPVDKKLTEADGLKYFFQANSAEFPAGTEESYSNTGYFLLSVIVQRVTGQTMAQYAKQAIFEPLNMSNTSFVDAYPANLPGLARGYADDDKGGYKIDESLWEMTGDGQVHTTVRDMAHWQRNLATGAVGGKKLMARMITPGQLDNGTALDYAAGLDIGTYRGLPVVQHSGGWAGYGGHFAWFPDQDFAAAVFCTGGHPATTMAIELAEVFLGDQMQPKVKDSIAAPILAGGKQAIETMEPGVFVDPLGSNVSLVRDGKQWLLESGYTRRITAAEQDKIYVATDDDGDISYLAFPSSQTMLLGDGKQVFTRQTPWRTKDLAKFAGRYTTNESEGTLEVSVQGEALLARMGTMSSPLLPIAENRFALTELDGVVDFEPGSKATIHSPYLRDFSFSLPSR